MLLSVLKGAVRVGRKAPREYVCRRLLRHDVGARRPQQVSFAKVLQRIPEKERYGVREAYAQRRCVVEA